jgi:hypothetical protein
MVSSDVAQIMSLHAGEAYAMQNLTKTDRLGLLISGKVRFIYSGVVGIYVDLCVEGDFMSPKVAFKR